MSLTLPDSYKRSNINENWLFQIFNSRDSFLSFDGSDDFIDYGITSSTISNLGVSASTRFVTFSFWINFPKSTEGNVTYVFMSNTKDDHWTGFNIYKDQDDKISLLISDANENTTFRRIRGEAIGFDRWYHVAITSNMDGDLTTSNTKIYVNNQVQTGSAAGSSISTGVGYHASGKTMFGKLLKPDPDAFYGFKIKNFAIWSGNSALDSDNLEAIYNDGVPRSLLSNFGNYDQASALRAYWEFNNAETYSEDLTGNISKGTINGGTYGGFLALAYNDTKVDDVFYHGSIVQSGAIRDSIDLKNSKAKSSNLSFQSANFTYKNDELIKDLLFGNNYYINKTVRVFSQPDNNSSLSNCIQIYNGRLIDINTSEQKNISFNIISKRPWDNIFIPTDRTATDISVPIVYGDYESNSQNAFQTLSGLYPMPKLRTDGDDVYFATPRSYTSGCVPHYYDDNIKELIIMGQYSDATSTLDSDNAVSIDKRANRGVYYYRPDKIHNSDDWDGSNPEYAIDSDTSTTTSQTINVSSGGIGNVVTTRKTLRLSMPQIKGQFSSLKLHLKGSVVINTATYNNASCNIVLSDNTFSSGDDDTIQVGTPFIIKDQTDSTGTYSTSGAGASSAYTEIDLYDKYEDKTDSGKDINSNISSTDTFIFLDSTSNFKKDDIIKVDNELMRVTYSIYSIVFVERGYSYSTAASHTSGTDIFVVEDNSYSLPPTINLQALIHLIPLGSGTSTVNATFNISDFYLVIGVENAIAREPQSTQQNIESLNFLYSSGDGLTAFNNWKTADSGLIKYGHEAHRDLLARFTNFDFDDDDIYNWSSDLNINSLRNNWTIRYWTLKEVGLEKILEEIQKEFAFIFKYKHDGVPSYLAVKNSYSSSDVVSTLTLDDIANINISHTSFLDLTTKMDIKYKMHPATEDMELQQFSEDSTTSPSPREKWGIREKENIESVDLKYNYEKQGDTNVASGNPNDGYANYYMNIFGDVKKVVSCSIVNPSKGFQLETGDIVKFDIDNIKPFGGDWNDYYMIVNIQKSLGKINITCREVG